LSAKSRFVRPVRHVRKQGDLMKLDTVPSSSGWRPISELPADRKDGRRMLLWEEDQPVIGRWDIDRQGWEDPENMHFFEEIICWADLLAPI
jgi:hypothetical protein